MTEHVCGGSGYAQGPCAGCRAEGAAEERTRAAEIIGALLHLHRLQFEAFGNALMDPDLHREATAYVAEAVAELLAAGDAKGAGKPHGHLGQPA